MKAACSCSACMRGLFSINTHKAATAVLTPTVSALLLLPCRCRLPPPRLRLLAEPPRHAVAAKSKGSRSSFCVKLFLSFSRTSSFLNCGVMVVCGWGNEPCAPALDRHVHS